MFTGIVEEVGEIVDVRQSGEVVVLTVRGPRVSDDAAHGDSIAVNGCCLTVADPGGAQGDEFRLELVPETLKRTSLGGAAPGVKVNLERALQAGARLGGHIVQGHVDGVGTVLGRTPGEHWEVVRVGLPPQLARYVVEKGSIAVDGVSLTVARVDDTSFDVSLIPETLERTTLGRAETGRPVNLEVDVLAKYVEKLLAHTR